ncbi:hypothetical protein FA95DRAFT_109478 [Auriscalpium vulgare]|uniref:Uncharacterized protein n=1 Tax=Auriscalpium vulgare TaxID=40419 RepID=A0ACB8S785_9AGAM|nr:hypothetical protein FA95DRAFT_109478 [Auriscalpium vulgare]
MSLPGGFSAEASRVSGGSPRLTAPLELRSRGHQLSRLGDSMAMSVQVAAIDMPFRSASPFADRLHANFKRSYEAGVQGGARQTHADVQGGGSRNSNPLAGLDQGAGSQDGRANYGGGPVALSNGGAGGLDAIGYQGPDFRPRSPLLRA